MGQGIQAPPAVHASPAWHWIWGIGFVSGLLLMTSAGWLPAHLQNATLYSGLALALVSVGGHLVFHTSGASLRWKGVSPAVALVVGLMAGVLPLVLGGSRVTGRDRAVVAAAAPGSAREGVYQSPNAEQGALTRRGALPGVGPALPVVSASSGGAPGAADPDAGASGSRLDVVRGELGELLARKARPVLESQSQILNSTLQGHITAAELASLRPQLEANARTLQDVKAALDTMKSGNEELSARLGDAEVLTTLDVGIRKFSEAMARNPEAPGTALPFLRHIAQTTMAADQWIDQQLAPAQSATPPVRR